FSNHGWVLGATLPAGALPILSAGPNPANVVAFSYSLGNGSVYYSTIPLDFYLDGNGPPALNMTMQQIYTPNMLTHGASLISTAALYAVSADVGAKLVISTSTPSDQGGEFANPLDPMLELFDRNGNQVASDDNSGADGRNAVINYTVPAGEAGAYYIPLRGSGSPPPGDPGPDVPPPPAAHPGRARP